MIRNKLKKMCIENNVDYSFPGIEFCTDNASMIAAAGFFAYKKGNISTLDLNAFSTLELK